MLSLISAVHPSARLALTQRDAADALTQILHALQPVMLHATRPVAESGSRDHATGADRHRYLTTLGVVLLGEALDLGRASGQCGLVGGTGLVVWQHDGLELLRYRGWWAREGFQVGRHYQRSWYSQRSPITASAAVREWAPAAVLRAAGDALLNGIRSAACPDDARAEAIRRAQGLPYSATFDQ